jgi:UDP-N-acetylglucosamine 1-carboxyvinyltransferase
MATTDALRIKGGIPVSGTVKVSGAKNSTLPLLAASLMATGPCELTGVPNLRDVETMVELMGILGVSVSWDRDAKRVLIQPEEPGHEAPYTLVKKMRASVLVLGPILARLGRAKVSMPGGCAIGVRPINLHLKALQQMAAKIEVEGGYVVAECNRLKGTNIVFDKVTVTGTENVIMAAALADGVTTIENSAREPEVSELCQVLRKMGAEIEGDGTPTITVRGVKELKGFSHRVMPDRIEAATLLLIGPITGGRIRVEGANPQHLDAVILKLREAGVEVEIHGDGSMEAWRGGDSILPVECSTWPYPGFPTDVQAQLMALLSLAKGTSVITENIFEDRFQHVAELSRMGANITVSDRKAVIQGVDHLTGAPVMASDLRASASLVLAALAARGESIVSRVYHLDRGYEELDRKLANLGVEIERIKQPVG